MELLVKPEELSSVAKELESVKKAVEEQVSSTTGNNLLTELEELVTEKQKPSPEDSRKIPPPREFKPEKLTLNDHLKNRELEDKQAAAAASASRARLPDSHPYYTPDYHKQPDPGRDVEGSECRFKALRADEAKWKEFTALLYLVQEDCITLTPMTNPWTLRCGHSSQPNFQSYEWRIANMVPCYCCNPPAQQNVFSRRNCVLEGIRDYYKHIDERADARMLCRALSSGYSPEDEAHNKDPLPAISHYELMTSAVILPCGHSFSLHQVEKESACPVCGAHFTEFVPNKPARLAVEHVTRIGVCGNVLVSDIACRVPPEPPTSPPVEDRPKETLLQKVEKLLA